MKQIFTFLCILLAFAFNINAQVNEAFDDQDKYDDIAIDGWINYIEAGSKAWYSYTYDGYSDGSMAYYSPYYAPTGESNIGWLITPGVDLDEMPDDSIKFTLGYGYCTHTDSDPVSIKYSLDFNGSETGIASATWHDITDLCNMPQCVSDGWSDMVTTALSIDSLSGTIYVAFVYSGLGSNGVSGLSDGTAVELENVVVGNPQPQSKIKSFTVDHQILDTDIDQTDKKIHLTVYPGTDITALAPVIEVSTGAIVSPASGAVTNFTDTVEYTVTSSDAKSVSIYKVAVDEMSSIIVPIHDLQYVADPETSDVSPYKGKAVLTGGIVTFGEGSGSGFIQSGTGDWSGIYVYVSYSNTKIELTTGDSVLVYGTVSEYYNLTEFMPDSLEVINDRNTVSATEVSAPLTESLEGVLVSLTNVTIKVDADSLNDEKAAWIAITETNDTVKIYNDLYDAFTPVTDTKYDLTGIVSYVYSTYRISPRTARDFSTVSSVENSTLNNIVSVFPNPANETLSIAGIETGCNLSVLNILGQEVLTTQLGNNNTIDISSLSKGVYIIVSENGTVRFIKE